jgi:hypothetical protein
MREYDVFEKAVELMRMEEIEYQHSTGYEKLVQTGEFESLSDYGGGFLYLRIRAVPTPEKGKYMVRVSLSTIDDGVWGAQSDLMSLDKAKSMSKRLSDILNIVKLPTEENLNKMLLHFGLFGCNEG